MDARGITNDGNDNMGGAELRNWIFVEYRMDVRLSSRWADAAGASYAAQLCAAHGIGEEA